MSEKEQEALKTIKQNMWLSMGAGLVPVPLVDLAAVAGVQLKVLAAISKIYGIPFKKSYGKAAIFSLIGFVLPHAMAFGAVGSLLKLIPVVGVMAGAPAMALFCAGYTWAMGNVFIQHFESGGTFLNFRPAKVREYFLAQFEEGRKMAAVVEKDKQAKGPADSQEA
jgi:uncharacterized protein (DUF697 family)